MPGMIPFDAASIFFLVSMAGSDRRKLKGSTVFCDDSLLLGKSSFLKLCELIFRSFSEPLLFFLRSVKAISRVESSFCVLSVFSLHISSSARRSCLKCRTCLFFC